MDKAALFADRIPRDTVEIPGIGTVTVRGLSRYELQLAGKNTEDASVIERRMVSYAMVEPALTETEVEQWQRVSPAGELAPVTEKIRDLSGLKPGGEKDAYKSVRDEPDAGV